MFNRNKYTGTAAWMLAWGILVQMTAAATVLGQQSGSIAPCPDGSGCPSALPVMEIEPGWSLYWHDPCRCWDDPCTCATCPRSGVPIIYGMAELMPLSRDQLEGNDYQVDMATRESVLTESDLRTEFDAGMRVLLGVALGDWYRVETSYFGSYGWHASAKAWNDDVNDPGRRGNLASPFSNFGDPAPIEGLDYNLVARVGLSSELQNVELNLRRRVCIPALNCGIACAEHCGGSASAASAACCFEGTAISRRVRAETSFLLGIRYMNLDEQFHYRTGSALSAGGANGSINDITIATGNEMVGVQVGWTLQLLMYRRRWFDVEMKGGIFQNSVSLRSLYVNSLGDGSDPTAWSGSDAQDRTSYVNELSVVYNHQVTPRITFRAGYNAFWIWQVALASQNLGTSIDRLQDPVVSVRHDGDVVYHGPNIGLVWAW